jgi:rhodanese-related sulfurtransferase
MKRFTDLIKECAERVNEIFPWDLEDILEQRSVMLLDVREPYEFESMHIKGAINVPRGILETACEYDFEDTEPELVSARDKEIIVICRSGNRSLFACDVMQQMGYTKVVSLKTGIRGWFESDQPMVNYKNKEVSEDEADAFFTTLLRPEQLSINNPA